MKKIYIGNLQWQTTDDELKTFFSPYGKVTSVQILKDRETGKSRGFGFVEMENDSEAEKAIKELDGKELNKRTLKINEAKKTRKPFS